MKTIIAGPRNEFLREEHYALLRDCGITEVVSGGARGVDTCGEMFADTEGLPTKVFPADWDAHGRSAGPIRNRRMAEYAVQLVAFRGPNGMTRGTGNMVRVAREMGLKVTIFDIDP